MSEFDWSDVKEGLAELRNCGMRKPVYEHALRTAAALASFPPPQIWSSGEHSVVFDWGTYYLTITTTKAYGFVSGERE